MSEGEQQFRQQLNSLVDEYRARCLWFLRADYYPQTESEIRQALDYVERYGDVSAFQKAATHRQWLSPGVVHGASSLIREFG